MSECLINYRAMTKTCEGVEISQHTYSC